ncbi:LOW QUALITY PROTEIN: N-acetyltransferase ESCO1 [Triplophysa dalaica]|uniref:LOW QUALITY PROTEIN: N-acetyltransferase ESCO1 n=1 Tax=Triplophysa dalaica TaxID=1582913 RepID=UPI0024DFC551|nr:LOW QUALITY PROTEIN: N-acetyltransferase ESCO1 [Triplophysa dalaica]
MRITSDTQRVTATQRTYTESWSSYDSLEGIDFPNPAGVAQSITDAAGAKAHAPSTHRKITDQKRMSSDEPEVKKTKMEESPAASDQPTHISKAPQKPLRGRPPKSKLLETQRQLPQSREENGKSLRRSSRLKMTQKKAVRGKRRKESDAANTKEQGSKVFEKPGDKPSQHLTVLKKGTKKYVSRVKRDSPVDSQTIKTVTAALFPVQIEHNYGRLFDLESEEITLPQSEKNNGASVTDLQSVFRDSFQGKVSLEEQMEMSTDPIEKITVSLDAKVDAITKSPPPLEAVFKVIQETSITKHTFTRKDISDMDELEVVNTCLLQDGVQSAEIAGVAKVFLHDSDAFLDDDVEIGHCVVEIETYEDSESDSIVVEEWPPDVKEKAPNNQTSDPVLSEELPSSPSLPNESATDLTQGPPKKQAMNPQARTKARLAALAEEKAAASKKAPSRQLNLLALCEEIADDIADDIADGITDGITYDAHVASDEKDVTQHTHAVELVEVSETKSETENLMSPTASETTALPEIPSERAAAPGNSQKRFFLSQVSLPLKTQEKKKLTRYQKLRQVELQRDKLTWTRVKKLKTDQAGQTSSPKEADAVSDSPAQAAAPVQLPVPESVPKVSSNEPRRALPAQAPPMPNGITRPKPKPVVDYKPYTPRRKYSPDDFELDCLEEETNKPATPINEVKPEQSSLPAKVQPKPSVERKSCALTTTENKPTFSTQQEPAQTTQTESNNGGSSNAEPGADKKEVKNCSKPTNTAAQATNESSQKAFGAVTCNVCGMLYSPSSPEDESHHLLFHNQFISAVRYVGWKKERILGEYPDGKMILVLPDDPKYALKKVEEIREMVDSDLGFQQVKTKVPSQTKTFLFISNDKKVAGCLIAEHIQEGYRVIEEAVPEGSEGEKVMFERQRAWCCSTVPEPALCGISRIWVFSMMRRRGIASRMIECLRNNFIYGSHLSKDEIAFSDPTPDGKLFATHYCGTSRFLVYNFVSGNRPT